MAPTVIRFMPSLFHLATVKVALPLFKNIDAETLCLAFREIQHKNSTSYNEGSRKNHGASYERAQEYLQLIPGHLRIKVLQAVKGFHYAAEIWREDHLQILKLQALKCILHWKSNGSIDTVKTAEHLVQNQKIRIRKRFQIACKYCLEKSVLTLWAEMEASGKTENFEIVDDPMVSLWVRWIREGSQVPWTRVAIESFEPAAEYPPKRFIRFSPFFHMLQPEDRERFLFSLEFTVTEKDDFLSCLYTLTSEEEEGVFKAYAQTLLCYLLEWPTQSLFLETAQKMWKFIDDDLFLLLLNHIFLLKSDREDFYYSELLEYFWYGSPNRLKEAAKKDPSLREVLSCFDEIATKRKVEDNEPTNSRKKKLVYTRM